MRRMLVLVLFGWTFALPASAVPPGMDKPTTFSRPQAEQFAQLLLRILEQIEREYVRPLPMEALLESAIRGLYESARLEPPSTLAEELRRGSSRAERLALLRAVRLEIGDAFARFQPSRDLEVALDAVARSLDPHCALIRPSDPRFDANDRRPIFGFEIDGITDRTGLPDRPWRSPEPLDPEKFGEQLCPWRVRTVVPGSPAQRSGLRPGDVITHWSGQPLRPDSVGRLLIHINSQHQSPSPNTLTVMRRTDAGDQTLTLRIMAEEYEPETVFGVRRRLDNSWDHWIDPQRRLGYIRLGPIEHSTPEQMSQAIQSLRAGNLRGVILDLRWCPGGYLDEAIEVTRMFLHQGIIARTQYRQAQRGSSVFQADTVLDEHRALRCPLVVLINGETSGGGELIAAALQDNQRAFLVGQRTLGKASIQWMMPLDVYGFSFKLSRGQFLRPSGANLQRYPDSLPSDDWGVRPSVGGEVFTSRSLSQRIKELNTLHVLRPASSREALFSDDPDFDPQRSKALRQLRQMVDGAK